MHRPIAAIAVVSLATLAVAQEDGTPPVVDQGPSVFVRDSGVAAERLSLAERLERQKEWAKAADVYQDLVGKFADRLIPSKKDDRGQPTQYVSAARVVQDRLAKWPAEGVSAYRRRFEDTARDLLNSDDPAAASKLSTLYFLTDAGRDAALRDMSSAFERGDFALAAAAGQRLLESHPNIEAQRPSILVQTGLAEHLAGRDADAKRRLEELQARYADAPARAGGADANAVELLQQQLQAFLPERVTYQADEWPQPFGVASASAVPSQVSLGGAKLFSVELPPPRLRGINGDQARQLQKAAVDQRRKGNFTGILPSTEGNTLFFQDNARVYAIDLASGQPLPGWAQTYSGEPRGAFAINALPTPLGRQSTVSVGGDRVVALLGQYNPNSPLAAGYGFTAPQLVALDRTTGRRVWAVQSGDPKLPQTLRDGFFYGSPLIDQTTVYALFTANRGQQFDECHLAAFNLADGALKWTTYVASASIGDPNMFTGDPMSGPPASVSMAGNKLYVLTNLGALACIDSANGQTQWLNVYTRNTPPVNLEQQRRFVRQPVTAEKPFALGPPVISDGRVFAMPTDSNSIFVYDATDGSLVSELPRTLESRYPAVRQIVGVIGDALVLANKSTLFRIPWRTFDPKKSLIDNGGMYKSIAPEEGDDTIPPDSIRGRPFLTDKSILVTTNERLYRISLKSFKIDAVYPEQGKWDDEESAGNIIATSENLVIAGPGRVTVYADLAVATAKLDKRLATDPKDVDASLRYAELLLAAGQAKNGIGRLDEAAGNLGGMQHLTPGPMRDRLFESALGYATKLQQGNANDEFVNDLFDRASAAAASPVQQVRWRVAKAARLRAKGDPVAEIDLQQQILSRADWRSVPAAGKGVPSSAGAEAEAAVAELIRLNGPWIYGAYETEAADALAKANEVTPSDPDMLLKIVDAYPASKLCTDLLTTAAEKFEAARQPRRATQTLRRLLKRDLPNDRRQATLQALARNHLAVPDQAAIAQVRLRQAQAIAPDAALLSPLTLPDGTALSATTVADAMTQVQAYRTQNQQRLLPVAGVPKTSDKANLRKPAFGQSQTIGSASAILEQQADLVRNDRVVVYGLDRRIGVVRNDSDDVRWTDASFADAPVGCGFIGDTLVVIGQTEVQAANTDGKLLWKASLNSLPNIDPAPGAPVADSSPKDDNGDGVVMIPPNVVINGRLINRMRANRLRGRFPVQLNGAEDEAPAGATEHVRQFRLLSDRVVVGTSTGRIAAMDAASGVALWQSRPSETPVGRLQSNDDFIAASFTESVPSSSVQVFDAVSGQTVLSKTYDGTNPQQNGGNLVNIAMSPDGVLITMLASQLVGIDLYDPGSGEWKRTSGRPNVMEMPFITSNQENQLVLTPDRVLAVYRSGSGQQSVHAYALRTLKPMTQLDPRNKQPIETPFVIREGSDPDANPVSILADGENLFVCSPRSASSYNLDHPNFIGLSIPANIGYGPARDYVLARDFFVQVVQPGNPNLNAQALPAIQLAFFSRTQMPSGEESGNLEQRFLLRDLATLTANEWQLADGAFYYVTNDQKLKVARATK